MGRSLDWPYGPFLASTVGVARRERRRRNSGSTYEGACYVLAAFFDIRIAVKRWRREVGRGRLVPRISHGFPSAQMIFPGNAGRARDYESAHTRRLEIVNRSENPFPRIPQNAPSAQTRLVGSVGMAGSCVAGGGAG